MFPWGDASEPTAPAYAVGERIANSYKPPSFGTVVSMADDQATMGIKWDDGNSAIVYPTTATYLRKALPWE